MVLCWLKYISPSPPSSQDWEEGPGEEGKPEEGKPEEGNRVQYQPMHRLDFRLTSPQPATLESARALFDTRFSDIQDSAEQTVREILAAVKTDGDTAALAYTQKFDYPQAHSLRVPDDAIAAATKRIQATPLWAAMEKSAARIADFHRRQLKESWVTLGSAGELLGQKISPLRRVGIYIPGGAAAYPSTVLMVGVPARVAGVREIALTTPPSKETGLPPDGTLAAAALAGITEIYAIGGAQAIGALAYGTKSIPRVDKIVGPGNVYVNLAKRQVFGTVGIDMLAGPSEVGVLVDHTTDPETAARELICQTEHDPLNSALLASSSEPIAEAILAAIERQLRDLPRADIVRKALAERSFLALTEDLDQAITVINAYAPEHLHVLCTEPWTVLPRIENAGAILLGPHSNAALGDYVAGPSHTLPTAGCARFASPLNVDDFLKKSSILHFDQETAKSLAEVAQIFGRYEGLEGHARAAV